VDGAKALLAAVLELGLSYTMEQDDVLHGYLAAVFQLDGLGQHHGHQSAERGQSDRDHELYHDDRACAGAVLPGGADGAVGFVPRFLLPQAAVCGSGCIRHAWQWKMLVDHDAHKVTRFIINHHQLQLI
jgi:hypothetical protein